MSFLLDLLILFVVIILPIGLAVYSVYQNLFKPKSPEIAGYIYDGSRLFHWLLIVLMCCWLLHLLVWCLDLFDSVFIPNELSIFSNGGVKQALQLLLIEFVYTICYVAVAFRPATAEELAEAKANKTLTMDLGVAAAGMGAAILASIVAVGGVIVAALNPINIIRVVGNTVYYTVKSAFASFASALFGLALIFGVVLCIIFAAQVYTAGISGAKYFIGNGVIPKVLGIGARVGIANFGDNGIDLVGFNWYGGIDLIMRFGKY